MSRVIQANSVSHALWMALHSLEAEHVSRDSRNGGVCAFPYPVLTEYLHPTNRVLFSPVRNANPFFHLMESLWMLAGRNDVWFPALFASRMSTYSDNGSTLAGAYGYRWLYTFGYDQIMHAADILIKAPDSRRAVISMWNPGAWTPYGNTSDSFLASGGGLDVPCNTHIYLDTQDGALNMTVCCRSNDILWGCYGANAVHFSMLMEFISYIVGVPVGVYRQFSNNLHLYPANLPRGCTVEELVKDVRSTDKYYGGTGRVTSTPLISIEKSETPSLFMADVRTFFEAVDHINVCGVPLKRNTDKLSDSSMYLTTFFQEVVSPMISLCWKRTDFGNDGSTNDWIVAGTEYRIRATSSLKGLK